MKTSVKKLIGMLLVCVLMLGMVPAMVHATDSVWDGTTLTEPAQVDGVYQIGTGAELAWFAQNAAASGSAVLTEDVDLGSHTWTPMAKLSGSFDGQNHTVKNLNGVNGLFASVVGASNTSRAEVKNVTVEGTVSGGNNAVVHFDNSAHCDMSVCGIVKKRTAVNQADFSNRVAGVTKNVPMTSKLCRAVKSSVDRNG